MASAIATTSASSEASIHNHCAPVGKLTHRSTPYCCSYWIASVDTSASLYSSLVVLRMLK